LDVSQGVAASAQFAETFIAIAALVVSVSALAVGVYEASLQRWHDVAEVWPHVELSTFISGNGATLVLGNPGLGPGIVRYVELKVHVPL